MKLSFKDRLKVLATGTLAEHQRAFLSGEDAPAVFDTETAMKYSAVNACIRVLSETFASVPLLLYQKDKNGKRSQASSEDIYDILHTRPNEEMSAYTFWETVMANFCAGGNAVCERQYNAKGELCGLYPYPHWSVKIERDKQTNELLYEIAGTNATKRTLNRSQVFHIPNLSFDGVIGLSPLTYAASAVRLGLSYEDYGVNFYKNAALPGGVMEHPGKLDDEAFERLKQSIAESYSGLVKAGKPMLLEGGMKWTQTSITPMDAQLIESKYFQIEDICRIYRVPQHLVNKLDRSTNNNIEHQGLEFVMYTMLPIFRRAEENINAQLLTPKQRKSGFYFEFKLDGLMRGDALGRSRLYASGVQNGWMNADEIRELENKDPLPNDLGKKYYRPSNLVEVGADDTRNQATPTASEANKNIHGKGVDTG